ncbi:hypothetical protein ACTFIU_008216 [Dictyostelium citrinum]
MYYSKQTLNGEWKLQLVNYKSDLPKDSKGEIPIKELKDDAQIMATVPGEVHMDLFNNNLIPDLYIGEKELEYRWIPESDWKYSREFKVSKKEYQRPMNIDLVCEGIDTVADIFINGIKIEQRLENMFRIHRIKDIKRYLNKPKSEDSDDVEIVNQIEIIIYSPSKYCKDLAKKYKYEIPEWEYPNGIHHRNFIRKVACHFGWDWSSCFCPISIFKDISLEFYSLPLIKEVMIHQNHKDYHLIGSVEIDISLRFYTSSICSFRPEKDLPIDISVVHRGTGATTHKLLSLNTSKLLKDSKYTLTMVINDAKLWWPKGHGEQNLYDVTISIPKIASKSISTLNTTTTTTTTKPILILNNNNSNYTSTSTTTTSNNEDAPITSPTSEENNIDSNNNNNDNNNNRNNSNNITNDQNNSNINNDNINNNSYNYKNNINNNENDKIIYKVRKTIGLRTSTIDVSKDIHGRKFQIVVNGVGIFAKGADWIPADHFLTRITNEKVFHLLNASRLANMNCLRVWGGGQYETDYFYEICDEFGIMLWQDFMFGCALYPTNKEFLKNVKKEVKCQVNRIGSHPSIILWCGSNESEQAIADRVWDPIKHNPHRYTIDFNTLYVDVIMKVLKKKLPDAFFWVSSPSNGVHEWGDPNDPTRGDTHYWGVWHGNLDYISGYLNSKSRFLSEFGFQSLPSFSELKKVLSSPDQLNITSPEMEGRQRSPNPGNLGILKHVGLHFRVPLDFELLCYTSQILQAISIKTGCEHWRRSKPYCMGTLYWQLNDVWVGPSWSSIEYNGNWKPLQYFAKKFYQPILLSFVENVDYPNILEVWLTHDYDNLDNIYIQSKLVILVWSLETSTIVNTVETIASVVLSDKNQLSKRVLQISKDKLFGVLPLPSNNYIVTGHFDCDTMKSNNQDLVSKFTNENYSDISNTYYPCAFKKLILKPTKIQFSNNCQSGVVVDPNWCRLSSTPIKSSNITVDHENKSFEFTIESTGSIALFVWIECVNYPSGYYSDNGFNLFKDYPKSVTYYPLEFDPLVIPEFTFTSLRDTY